MTRRHPLTRVNRIVVRRLRRRRAVEHEGDVPGAYRMFLEAQRQYQSVPFNHNPRPMLETGAFHALILGLVKATYVEHAVHVAGAMREMGAGMPLRLLSQMISALPCRVSSQHAVALVNALGPTVSGRVGCAFAPAV